MTRSKAIVNSGSRKLIGELDSRDSKPGDVVKVYGAYELRSDMFLIPTPQGPITITQNNVVPLDAEESPVNISICIDNIRWFDEMEGRGQKYENMIAGFEEIMMQNRAQRAGITTAKAMPKAPSGKLIV
jgi:hypothetical protein